MIIFTLKLSSIEPFFFNLYSLTALINVTSMNFCSVIQLERTSEKSNSSLIFNLSRLLKMY